MISRFRRYLNHRKKPYHESFSYRPDDVVIVSYPKSGSTWLRFILAHLIDTRSTSTYKAPNFMQVHLSVPEISIEAQENGVNFDTLSSPRFLRSHEPYSPVFPKVIYLLRDGRDVLISFYHHFRKFHAYSGSLSDFINSDVRRGEWNDHVNSWLYRDPPIKNLLLVRYEDMLSNPNHEIQRVVQFGNLSVTDEQIKNAVLLSSFDSMRNLENNTGLGYVDPGDPEIKFVRSGQAGEWKNVFTKENRFQVNKLYGETLKRAGYHD